MHCTIAAGKVLAEVLRLVPIIEPANIDGRMQMRIELCCHLVAASSVTMRGNRGGI